MSRGETSFGEKRRTCANFGKKWGEMIFGEKRRREKCRGEKRHLGRNVFPPMSRHWIKMFCKHVGNIKLRNDLNFSRTKKPTTMETHTRAEAKNAIVSGK